MFTVDNVRRNVPAGFGTCFIDQKRFFKEPEGRPWKNEMEEYIARRSNSQFNRGRLKAHFIQLAIDCPVERRTGPLRSYVEQNTVAQRFILRAGEPGYVRNHVESFAVSAFKVIGLMFLNVITLGLASLFWSNKNAARIEELNVDTQRMSGFQAEQNLRLNAALPRIQEAYEETANLDQSIIAANLTKAETTEERDCKDIGKAKKELVKKQREKKDIEDAIVEILNTEEEEVPSVDGIDPLYVGPIDSHYKKQDADSNDIESKFKEIPSSRMDGNRRIPVSIQTPQGEHVNKKNTMDELLNAVFDWAGEELLKKAEDDIIHFNHSHELINDEGAKRALVKFMVYLMIDTAGINAECDHVPHLILNKCKAGNLTVDPSAPFRVKKSNGNGFEILYKNHDSWTPVNPEKFPRGLDPLGAKWILTRIEEDANLTKLLQQNLLKPLLRTKAKESTDEIQLLDQLIDEIASALMERYETLFELKFSAFANDANTALRCDSGVKSVNFSENAKPWIDEELRKAVLKSKQILTIRAKRAKELCPSADLTLVLPNETNKLLQEIRKYFNGICLNINDEGTTNLHGSLFSSLALSLFQGAADKTEINPALMRKAMANYLEAHKESWTGKVRVHTQTTLKKGKGLSEGWTVDQYITWLKGEDIVLTEKQVARKNDNAGELEIDLFAYTFGIQVEVFAKNQPLTLKDGEFIASASFGPKTIEKLYLLNTFEAQHPFRALSPIVASNSEDEELKGIVAHQTSYFGKNSDQRLKMFGTSWKNFTV